MLLERVCVLCDVMYLSLHRVFLGDQAPRCPWRAIVQARAHLLSFRWFVLGGARGGTGGKENPSPNSPQSEILALPGCRRDAKVGSAKVANVEGARAGTGLVEWCLGWGLCSVNSISLPGLWFVGAAEWQKKKSVSAGAILPSSFPRLHRTIKTLFIPPDSFHNPQEKSQISTPTRRWFCSRLLLF